MKINKINENFILDQCIKLIFFYPGDRRNSQTNSIGSDASSPPDSPYGSQYLNPPTGTHHYIALSWTIVNIIISNALVIIYTVIVGIPFLQKKNNS